MNSPSAECNLSFWVFLGNCRNYKFRLWETRSVTQNNSTAIASLKIWHSFKSCVWSIRILSVNNNEWIMAAATLRALVFVASLRHAKAIKVPLQLHLSKSAREYKMGIWGTHILTVGDRWFVLPLHLRLLLAPHLRSFSKQFSQTIKKQPGARCWKSPLIRLS